MLDNGIMGESLSKLIWKPFIIVLPKSKNLVKFQIFFLAPILGITHFPIAEKIIYVGPTSYQELT